MINDDYTKISDDTIKCKDCAFDEDCEERFNTCVANYQHEGKSVHLKCCELIHWNTMTEDEKTFFLQEVLPNKYKNEEIC